MTLKLFDVYDETGNSSEHHEEWFLLLDVVEKCGYAEFEVKVMAELSTRPMTDSAIDYFKSVGLLSSDY